MDWLKRMGLAGAMTVWLATNAWAQGSDNPASHVSGSVYLSYGLFVLLGMIAVLLVFKGTRTK